MTVSVDMVRLTKIYKGTTVASVDDISMTIAEGQLMALLGPSGCGKTTTMKMLAGLLDPTAGDVLFGGESVIDIPAEKRNVAMVFQKPLLFPHMSIGDNVAFGLRMRGVDRKTRKRKVGEMMELVHLTGMEDRRPGQLSGGQEQRVSLARSLITEPDILLLDEPLSQLDANLRIEMRDLIRQIQAELGITSVFVTHDQEEAVMLADRIALMLEGRIQQDGLPQSFYEQPSTLAVARFFGTQNFVSGSVSGDRFESVLGSLALAHEHPQGEGVLVVRQEAIEVGDGENSVEATVDRAMYLGTHVRVWVKASGVLLQFTAPPGVRYEAGQVISLRLPTDQTWVVPAEDEIL
ncbi:MAG: ABC transporter ATP-binding protein [Chloroflexota bacterium]